mgnify:FL=1
MSIFWDRKTYDHAFKYKMHQKTSPFWKLVWKWYPCPGCVMHDVNPRRQEILFEHYHKRPQKSWMIYWRSHPLEYQQLLESIKK